MAKLSPKAVARIEEAVEKLFVRAKSRFMGGIPPGAPKHLIISIAKGLSIPGVFQQAARAEGVLPNEDLQSTVTKIGLNYLDAIKERAKARTVQSVQAFLTDAQKNGVDTDVETVLGGQIADLWGTITGDVKRIVESETTAAKNISIADAISKINASAGINDPIVYFIIVKDGEACEECVRLHTMDGKTPRLWKMSEVGSGYHKKGDDSPKATGLHTHCRCQMASLMPGYGFDSNGRITYISQGWDELKNQRGS